MKVLQLRDATGVGAPVELHAQITLVRSLDPVRRAWLIDVLGRLAGGRGLPATGELEAQGIRFDLDDDALTLLGLDDPVDAVVTASDLPGHDAASADAARSRAEAIRQRDDRAQRAGADQESLATALAVRDEAWRVHDQLVRGEGAAGDAIVAATTERTRLKLEQAAARDECSRNEELLGLAIGRREQAVEDRSRLRTRLDAAQNRRRIAMALAAEAAGSLEAVQSGVERSTDPSSAIEAAAERLARAEQAVAEDDPDHDASPLNQRLADLERRRVELARLEVAMGDGGSEDVAEALDHLLGASTEAPPVVAALALADSWRDLHQQISALEAGVSAAETEAEKRVAAARRSVVEAESDFNQPVLTPEQISKVEASHTAVLESQDRAEGRFGGARAKKRLDELRADERRVLERLGFSTYADYMMSSSSRGVGQANRSILETARGRLVAAEQELEALPGAGDRARRRIELLQRRDAVAPRVADLLGHEPTGPEAEDDLRLLREPTAADQPAMEALADRLIAVGVDVGPGPHERDDLILFARAYLAEERSAEAERTDLTKAVAALDTAIDDLRLARSRGETEVPDLSELPSLAEPVPSPADETDEVAARTLREARWAEVESARSVLSDAQAELARQQVASTEVERLSEALARATKDEAHAAGAVAEAEAELGSDMDARVAAAGDQVAEAETALAEARARENDASTSIARGRGASGSESLVLDAEVRLAAAEVEATAAADVAQAAAAVLGEAEVAVVRATEVEQAANAAAAEIDRSALVDDIEWQLLSRLAGVRSVGPGGSVPLVLDDPFPALRDDEVAKVLDHLAQIAGAVQVVMVSDRSAVVDWAEAVGSTRVGIHVAA